ncbi:Oidioi.mRNA.OKI2018_I69.PAR.g13234.t1.cds [Oikopleura dioica]|uniref:Oidioi.mRNA.OKI2018_I69.PAR.g13234.t1.cds n=1 Tax=Oikopleura dioica TaxID=34765 RepID=A0ABN7S3T9_OIKDI|nr:Oidioi.mRNA.OKI2018_I69.PAR.g13234.t1.cds [Oikopleura dioica]
MPYNYILDKKIKNNTKINTTQKIVIIDEAHNLEAVSREELREAKIKYEKEESTVDLSLTPGIMNKVIEGIKKLEYIYAQNFDNIDKENGETFNISMLLKDAEKTGLMGITTENWINLSKNVILYFSKTKQKTPLSGTNFEIFAYMMEELHAIRDNYTQNDYKSRLCRDETDRKGYKLMIWCFNAKYAIEALTKEGEVYNLILTSGTLSPLKTYIKTLGLDIKTTIQLQNDHIINAEQLLAITITGYENTEFRNIYKQRDNQDMFMNYAKIIQKIKEVAPGGCLVFHPTYKCMEKSMKIWKINTTNETFNNMFNLPVFAEPVNKEETERIIESYEREIEHNEKKGAIMNGVCRGKLSEGIDFKDARARVVVVTGIPYPPMQDPKIKEKMAYLDKRQREEDDNITGKEWYKQGKSTYYKMQAQAFCQ